MSEDFDKFLENSSDNKVNKTGGARRSKKPAKSVKSSSKKTKKGGALVDDIKNLAVPFAILLAKQGVQTLFEKKDNQQSDNAVATSSPQNVKKNSNANANANSSKVNASEVSGNTATKGGSVKRQSAGAGNCQACQPIMTGGKKSSSRKGGSPNEENIKKKYTELATRIEKFLSNY